MPHILFTRFQSLPDAKEGFYPGVLVVEKGLAKGHFAVKDNGRVVPCDWDNPEHINSEKYQVVIGDDSLDDVVAMGKDGVKAKLDHGSTVKDLFGRYTNFRREGDQVRADLTLLNSYPHKDYVEELISTMSKEIGNSIDFAPTYEIQGNNAVARCRKLNSVDIVDSPAATNSLFEEKPTLQTELHMPLSKEDLEAIGGVVDTKLSAFENKVNARFAEVTEKMDDGEEDDKDKKKKDDEKSSDEKMEAMVAKATLSAVKSVFPKATLESLATVGKPATEQKDEWTEKMSACIATGMTQGEAKRQIARKFPEVYNARFGAGAAAKL